ncbi:MAG: nucleotidyltransferase family protein [Candidatus Heimdallarchaeota archaeon]|nr:nucleotidyltransferase family protein [Candidatus Heimdallarchaeota archaeon]MCG3255033.1 nucleotidyltransferase family protein [Candidatus Heimdallarchaeota archaeon]MCK4610107.1 nucleotidyltransferase family protein [Candidatus Heimdallarchaeota archaeon]
MTDTVGILFCGGEGTRMRPLTYYMQKVMMPIGEDQVPILEYVLKHFRKHGINDIILLVNYKKEQIQGYFGDGEKLGMNLIYVPDKPGPVGTGTALLNAQEYIGERKMIIYYSDIITNVNFSEMVNYHINHGKWATILASKGWKIRVGTAEVDTSNKVKKFVEKPQIPLLVNTGISILDPIVFNYLNEFDSSTSIDLSKDIFPKFVENEQMYAYIPDDVYWEDIGSIERYEKLDGEFITGVMRK